jgi:hypothetical protein
MLADFSLLIVGTKSLHEMWGTYRASSFQNVETMLNLTRSRKARGRVNDGG